LRWLLIDECSALQEIDIDALASRCLHKQLVRIHLAEKVKDKASSQTKTLIEHKVESKILAANALRKFLAAALEQMKALKAELVRMAVHDACKQDPSDSMRRSY
jgi:uncharacterized protein YlaI